MADPRKLDLEDRTAQVINTVMFVLLGVGFAIVMLFALVDRIRAATSPANFLHDSWEYALGTLAISAWIIRLTYNGVRALRRRTTDGQP